VPALDEEEGLRPGRRQLDLEEGEDLETADAADADAPVKLEEDLLSSLSDEAESWSDDPVRMYLTQMGEIPLLTRAQEIFLAKKIEVTRRRFRTKLLECDYVIQQAYKVLKRVHEGELPFDRTVQVSVTDKLEQDQILGRLPHNLRTLEILLKRNRKDYLTALGKSNPKKKRDRLGSGFLAAAAERQSGGKTGFHPADRNAASSRFLGPAHRAAAKARLRTRPPLAETLVGGYQYPGRRKPQLPSAASGRSERLHRISAGQRKLSEETCS
jgi:hypothetical protein